MIGVLLVSSNVRLRRQLIATSWSLKKFSREASKQLKERDKKEGMKEKLEEKIENTKD